MPLLATELAATVLARADALARFSEEPERLTRRFGTPALRAAGRSVMEWMTQAGMETRRDAIGNAIGRTGAGPETLLLGSHLDTVVDAGRFDGALGVLVAIAAVQAAGALPFAVEVYGFADEEGLRFRTAYLASGAVAGAPVDVERTDSDGVRLGDLLDGDPASARREGAGLLGYVEVHIEQGPMLEHHRAPLGVVTAIAGQSRATVAFEGEAGHAGTVPMAARRDALAAAAEWISAVEDVARTTYGLTATVGEVTVEPGASNVIPGRVACSLDVRHADDEVRLRALERLREAAKRRLDIGHEWSETQANRAVACDPALTERLAAAAPPGAPRLVSGAGHDAVAMSALAPVAMLFVRCRHGISHHPDESVDLGDVAEAIEATTRFLQELR